MTKRHSSFALTILLCLWLSPLVTQAKAKQSTQLHALAVGFEQDLQTVEILDADMQPAGQLNLRKFSFSKAFTAPIVEGQLIFGVADGKDESGKPKYRPIANFDWKDSYDQSCLLFIPKSILGGTEQNDSGYTIQSIDMNTKSFEFGHTQIVNLTPWEATVRAGEHELSIAAGDQSVIKEIKELNKMNMTQLDVSYEKEGTSYNAYQTRMRYLPRIRYIVLIYRDIKNDRVAVSLVKDSGSLFK